MASRSKGTKVKIEDLADRYERCAGIDVHKESVTVCIIAPRADGEVEGEVEQYPTTTAGLRELSARLLESGVGHVAMESTGVYWKPVWQILESGHFQLLLAHAKEVRNMPGRKTDQADAVWLATLLRKGLLRASFVPPAEIRALRDLCRSRATLVRDRIRVAQRLEKVLEEANIKLDTVASDLLGKGSRRMLNELAAGNTDAGQMAELALGRMRSKIPQLVLALEGYFRPHQLFVLRQLLKQYDALSEHIEDYEKEIQAYARPFEAEIRRLTRMPGFERLSAITVISETGVDMNQFPSPEKFARWATICPGNNQSGGRRRNGQIGAGNRWLRGVLTQCAWAATHVKDCYYAAQYRRLLHRGKKRALVAVAHSMLTALWHMLQHGTDFRDLGAGFFLQQNLAGQTRACVKKLEKLGFSVTLQPIAA